MKRFYIGTYTEPIRFGTGELLEGKGNGIYLAELDENGNLTLKGLAAETKNPSFLAVSRDGRQLFAVNELKEYEGEAAGSISTFAVDAETGTLCLKDQRSTRGQDPCHVAVCGENRVVVSNFMSGSICCYIVKSDGKLRETDFAQHEGHSVHPVRQRGPHAHSCIPIPETDRIVIPDLGVDRLMVYQLCPDGSLVFKKEESYDCIAGSGPRFGEFDEKRDLFYVINELESAISVLYYDRRTGRMERRQQISTLPDACDNICADLHLTKDRKFLFASNRGHDSIAGYQVLADGTLEFRFHVPCGGKTPRNFAIEPDGAYLLAGNQDTDEIVVFAIDGETGKLQEVSRTAVPTPVCICSAGQMEN